MPGNAVRITRLELVRRTTCASLELELRKLDRLRELRATIDSLRDQQESADPLLAWVLEQQEGGQGPPRD
jgi:hypothetical protein